MVRGVIIEKKVDYIIYVIVMERRLIEEAYGHIEESPQ